ncbi:efflux RND transporter periplasmic adaptor subunit [Insolitispirillum peregrinum]|uniref:RND family efflux transporter, MFP subunit n=1 Tax=Insolitispirillum peregrinum TaxID=80876 RepID=A0A1N7PJZ3_9PROT|nr:efflux RND transporter periplasmic adaptor subunit [Insolitispirillum peregrinum]SIT10699.1 RND family efflux transporter, MFP subunit [Insolitispirillum peregrinum]
MMPPFVFSRCSAAAVLLALMALAVPAHAAEPPLTIRLETVTDRKAVFGTVEAADVQQARARIGGTVAARLVDEGDRVSDGQVVAMIGDPKLALKLQSARAGIQSLQAERAQAATELERTQTLFAQGVVAKARLDTARTAVDVLDRTIAAQVAESRVVEQQSAEGAIKAPGAGRVLEVLVTPGAVVMAGEPVATIATGAYVLRIEVPERHARFIKVGDPVQVGPRGLDAALEPQQGTHRQGTVRKVYPRLGNGRVQADISVDGLGDYFVGERTLVWVGTGERSVILLPPEFLRLRSGVTFATLASGAEVVVQPGQTMPQADGSLRTEILSGLNAGDQVIRPVLTQGAGQ